MRLNWSEVWCSTWLMLIANTLCPTGDCLPRSGAAAEMAEDEHTVGFHKFETPDKTSNHLISHKNK